MRSDSIDVGSSSFDDTLRGPNFLDAQRFPDIHFESTRVEKRDDSTIDLTGDLTLLGVTRPLTVEVEVKRLGGARLAFVAHAHIDRLAYGMNSGFPIISRDVDLDGFERGARRMKAPPARWSGGVIALHWLSAAWLTLVFALGLAATRGQSRRGAQVRPLPDRTRRWAG